MCAGDGIAPGDVLDLLARLVAKSLVLVEERASPRPAGGRRYRLLETVRQYAHDRLLDTGEALVVQRRHRDWAQALVEEAAPALRGPEQLVWLAGLEGEHDNLPAALAWCRGDDPVVGLRLAGGAAPFWRVRRYFAEGRCWLEGFLARARTLACPCHGAAGGRPARAPAGRPGCGGVGAARCAGAPARRGRAGGGPRELGGAVGGGERPGRAGAGDAAAGRGGGAARG